MGKSKRDKKNKQDVAASDDLESDLAALSIEDPADVNGTKNKPGKKDKKKAPQKKVAFDESESESEEDDDDTPVESTKGKSTMSAFQMLNMDDDDNDSIPSEDSEKEEEPTPEPVAPKPEPAKLNKKGKKGKEKKVVEEFDIDALVAEIESKPEKGGKKKGKKGRKDEEEKVEEKGEEVEEETKGTGISMEGKDLSAMTQDEIAAAMEAQWAEEEEEDSKKKKKKKGKQKTEELEEEEAIGGEGVEEEGPTVKTPAQKKKEKKEREKQRKAEEKLKKQQKQQQQQQPKKDEKQQKSEEIVVEDLKNEDEVNEVKAEGAADADAVEESESKKKRDKKKKKGKEEKEPKEKKKSKLVLALLEQQKKQQEAEEAARKEEEEKERRIEAALKEKEEKERLVRERKEKEKQRQKERIAKQKAEGTYLSAAEREKRRRQQQMLDALRAQGVDVPQIGEKVQEGKKKGRVVYGNKKKQQQKNKEASPTSPVEEEKSPLQSPVEEEKPVVVKEEVKEEVKDSWDAAEEEEEDVRDEWDASDEEEEQPEDKNEKAKKVVEEKKKEEVEEEEEEEEESEEESEEEDESDEDSDDESEESEDDSEDEGLTTQERLIEKARVMIEKRKEKAEKKRSLDNLRAPVVCVLGHVDTGKTKILDKLRRTNVQDGEAGGITQQIGATNVPEHTIKEQTKMCKEFSKQPLRVPGLLIIDTPGHESFSNLRMRGSSLCDIAVLVVDLMHGLEPQTIESINLLKKGKTPFVVALNKIDRLYGWQTAPHSDVANVLKKQKANTKIEFEERMQLVKVQFAEQGLNTALFCENKNPKEYISLIPTSAHTGDGIGNLIALICELTQNLLAKRLAFSEELQATVMEVKAIHGLGTTIDVILVNGSIKEGQTIVVAGQEGPIVTTIRGLLMPQPLKELRVKNAYEHHKEVVAAQGCKIIAKDLDKALAGLNMYVSHSEGETELYKEELSEALTEILASIKLQDRGVFVQASTLGSLEALLEFLRTSKIPYAGINIGPVHKRDIMKASAMLSHDDQFATILAFDVKVEREAQEMADSVGVRIFTAEIIYHLFDQFMAFREELKRKKQEEFKHIAVFPCKLRIMPQFIFNSRDPIVMGVSVEAGFVKIGTPICVPSKEGVFLGIVTSLELNHKPLDKAVKGQEVCIKIENPPGETPKLYGRHFESTDMLISKISRQSIDCVKNYFRDEMSKTDWQLIMELKKLFEII